MAARFEKTGPTTHPRFSLQLTFDRLFAKIVIDEVELPPPKHFLSQTGQAGRQAQSMALCLVRVPEATMAAAMAARSWIQWLGRGLAGICACPAGARSTGLRPRNPVRSLSAF